MTDAEVTEATETPRHARFRDVPPDSEPVVAAPAQWSHKRPEENSPPAEEAPAPAEVVRVAGVTLKGELAIAALPVHDEARPRRFQHPVRDLVVAFVALVLLGLGFLILAYPAVRPVLRASAANAWQWTEARAADAASWVKPNEPPAGPDKCPSVTTNGEIVLTYTADGVTTVTPPQPKGRHPWIVSQQPDARQLKSGAYVWTLTNWATVNTSYVNVVQNGSCQMRPIDAVASKQLFKAKSGKGFEPGTDLGFQLPQGAQLVKVVLSADRAPAPK